MWTLLYTRTLKMNKSLPLHFFFALILSCFYSHSFAEPSNLSLLKKEIRQYHDSGEYERELTATINQAEQFLLAQVQALRAHNPHKKLALVLDIDETSISNYDKMVLRDFAGTPEQIHQEILKGGSPAIQATFNLYQLALTHHVDVFFVTGRIPSELEATKENLITAGYQHWAGIYVRPEQYPHDTIIKFKAQCRADIERQGYVIIESIGDQHSDLEGGHALKGFKLPNPYYYIH